VAVTLVLLDHLVETIGAASSPISIRIAWQLGRLGVILFFVHTTYVLMMSMQRRGLTGPTLVKDFYVRRGFRIYPLALAAVATVILFGIPRTPWSGLHPELTPVTVLSNVLLVQDLTSAPALLGPMWSLSPEVLMYLALPFLFLIVRARPLWSTVAALWFCAVIVAVVAESSGAPQLSVAYFAPCFMSGVVAFWARERREGSWPFWAWALSLSSIIALYLGIGTLSEDALHRAPRPVLVAGELRERFRPVGYDLVRSAQHVEPTLVSSDGREAGICGLPLNRPRRFADDESGDQRSRNARNDDNASTRERSLVIKRLRHSSSYLLRNPGLAACGGHQKSGGMCG